MKKILSMLLAMSLAMSVYTATAPIASAEVQRVDLPTAGGESHTWEAEDCIDYFTGPEQDSVKEIAYTYDIGGDTAHS